jgi:hypothetical protein
MQKITLSILLTLLLSSCNGWIIQPLPGPTPFLPATPTPSIFTPTPVVIGVTSASATSGIASPTATTIIPTNTETSIPMPTLTSSPTGPAIAIKVLGCNTSIDITHSMGEVTNAFVTLKNTGGMELTNIKVTLFALDEGREHPDKTVELTSLPIGYQVTVKLTVDSTYQQESAIQVEVISNQGTFPREGSASCTDIGVFAPNPDALNTPIPNVP